MKKNREPAVAGMFYESSSDGLINQLNELFDCSIPPEADEDISALILPHAGYMFSGKVAAAGVNLLNSNNEYKRIFIIGSSHKKSFDGASVYTGDSYITPLGKVDVDKDVCKQLYDCSPIMRFTDEVHQQEHTLEVQIPMLQYKLKKDFKIVPIIIGTANENTCLDIAAVLKPYFLPGNLFVVSTDFSHYPNYIDANKVDNETADAILLNNPDALQNIILQHKNANIKGLATSLCGWSAILTLLHVTKDNHQLKFKKIMYENSGDSDFGEKNRVVGYHAISVAPESSNLLQLTEGEKLELIKIARDSIISAFENEPFIIAEPNLSQALKTLTGAFVSVYRDKKLAGCIGQMGNKMQLWKVVAQCARSAAFDDNRFKPIKKDEMENTLIEISVITPMEKISSVNQIVPGKHGIFIKKENKQGTFLPQVALRMKWNQQQMLEHCSRDKAGLGADGWKEAEIFIYEAIIIKEKTTLE